ncbi:MAG: hypothetical protein QOJ46_1659 [bacterium]|jgi:SAM-dependent methyltransferase/uncharacterized protein YbaR (Trm112 family)
MRTSLLPILRCPRCRSDASLRLSASRHDEREIREGELACAHCAATFAIEGGIAKLLPAPPAFVAREAAGLERFAEAMRNDGWDRQRILALPWVELGYWQAQGQAIKEVLESVAFQPGQRLLDVGSNTCWASNIFARRGLDVIALDIATTELQGLATADYFLETGEVYFERLQSVMYDPALASESLDYVFCCEVLHHNDPANLRRTLRELYRVLRPGGRLIVVNEPLRFLLHPKLDHAAEVAEFEGNEHVYFASSYVLAARAAGFRVAQPWMRGVAPGQWHPALRPLVACRRIGRWAWRHVIVGDRALFLDGRKPG